LPTLRLADMVRHVRLSCVRPSWRCCPRQEQ
jgi:hypothetical protein